MSSPEAGSDHDTGSALGPLGRSLFTLLPVTGLALVVWKMVMLELPLEASWPWVPDLGLELLFRIDGLSALMLLMITGVGSAVFVYAGGYFAGNPGLRRLYILLSLFAVAMVGAVTADHLILLFMFWEATSVLSFLLVGFKHDHEDNRKSAQQALLVTGTGGLALLGGFILVGEGAGTYVISELVVWLPEHVHTPQLNVGLGLILVGAFTKSAQFPFHFWLPNAMAAPTPVSAYLHSATMVKLGVYLLARLDPGFGEWAVWEWSLKGAGSITAAWGMVLALGERDLKRILAWSTVATLGTLVMLVGLRGDGATVAVGALLLAHALYKAPLFFVAGNIDYGTGTRDIDKLGNLRRYMPWTAAAALLAGASMAGMPLSFGYVAKDVILDAKTSGDIFAFAKAANTLFGAVAVAVAGVAAIRVFWSRRTVRDDITQHVDGGPNNGSGIREGGIALVGPPLALALSGIALGVFPFFAEELIAAATGSMTADLQETSANLRLELGPTLTSFATTFVVGALIYWKWDPLHRLFGRLNDRLPSIGLGTVFNAGLAAVPRAAAATTRMLQGGRLPTYVAMALGGVVLALGASFAWSWSQLRWPDWSGVPSVAVIGGCVIITIGAVTAPMVRSRFVLLLATGLVGYGCGVLFLFSGAPDVAYTQFTVETVFVIVVASVLLALKRQDKADALTEPRWRPGAFVLALAFGAVVTVLLLVATAGSMDPTLSNYFAETSVPEAYGRNVVNVILVDYRALDTLGEITVVFFSFLAALPMLRALRSAARRGRARRDGGTEV